MHFKNCCSYFIIKTVEGKILVSNLGDQDCEYQLDTSEWKEELPFYSSDLLSLKYCCSSVFVTGFYGIVYMNCLPFDLLSCLYWQVKEAVAVLQAHQAKESADPKA